jgi:hypothetical protein
MIVSHTVYKDAGILTFTPIKARYVTKENYISIRSRGTMLVEYIRRDTSPADPSRVISTQKILMYREKKGFAVPSDSFYDILTIQSQGVQLTRNSDTEQKALNISKKGDSWEWSIEVRPS